MSPAELPTINRQSSFLFQFPQHVDDLPFAVKLRDLEIIDPVSGNDLDHGCVVEAVEDRDLF
jgi:hypothetical protein